MVALTKKQKLNIICNDFEKFSENFIKIINNDGDKVPFKLNAAQQELHEMMNKNRFSIVSKARQSGISTMSISMALWRAVTKPNENILIVSYKSDSSKALFQKLKTMNDWLPREKYPNLFPTVERDNRDELLFTNGSRITCAVASHKDVGRGSTFGYIHISEFAFMANQKQQLLSLEQCLAKGSESNLVIETTSNGTGNMYYDLCMSASKNESKYKLLFIPFFHKLYSDQFSFEYDEAEKWHKEAYRGKRLTKADLEKDEIPLHKMGANLRQLMWRRYKLLDMTLQQFQQEYPSNLLESFISTGKSVFDQSKVIDRINYCNKPYSSKDMKDIIPSPLLNKFIGSGLLIFHKPQPNKRYYGGVDTASGSGGDNSTITIYDSEGQQVLSFFNNRTPVYEFAEVIDCIGRWYNYAFLCIERNSYGLPILERLRKDYNYLNLYKQKIFNIKTGKKQTELGFQTTATTKAVMISDFKEQFERGLINLECKETLQEMQLFVESNDGKMGNKRVEGLHDDLVISAALAVQAIKINKWYVDQI